MALLLDVLFTARDRAGLRSVSTLSVKAATSSLFLRSNNRAGSSDWRWWRRCIWYRRPWSHRIPCKRWWRWRLRRRVAGRSRRRGSAKPGSTLITVLGLGHIVSATMKASFHTCHEPPPQAQTVELLCISCRRSLVAGQLARDSVRPVILHRFILRCQREYKTPDSNGTARTAETARTAGTARTADTSRTAGPVRAEGPQGPQDPSPLSLQSLPVPFLDTGSGCTVVCSLIADVAELVDAQRSGRCGSNSVEVRVLSSASTPRGSPGAFGATTMVALLRSPGYLPPNSPRCQTTYQRTRPDAGTPMPPCASVTSASS